ncbi:Aldehyde dehydrogenase (NAD(+)) [Saliniradius amylolyticus]|uniref:Aldehyde dehydrogenase (NAD(+)) n=1 Tax=Saliniradius amylolyticus TaxID=2183582 RepID=A0A2S2DZB0_9ALTE|nr:aldehyde dehydrogenase family protein [Saliniradius amylolyticus]AWL10731.1 Aldehyde dehydrogenase (NAD(+)) [Saliniradius amylolyticus]
MKQINRHYINGQWQPSPSQNTQTLIHGASGAAYAELTLADASQAEQAVMAARQAFQRWSSTPKDERADAIGRIVAELKARRDDLVDAIVRELSCPRWFVEEIQVDDPIDAFAKHETWTRELTLSSDKDGVRQQWLAKGVAVLITPWNYPLHQLVAKVAPALAAGCTMVVKPSELSPENALILAEAIDAAGLPEGVFNLVIGAGDPVGNALIQHPEVDVVSFTGSTGVGKAIQQTAASSTKRVCLEMGGKSPYLIAPTEQLSEAVSLGVEDVMLNAGQTCNALTRMLVHEEQYAEACDFAATAADSINIGLPDTPDVVLSALVSKGQYQKVQRYIELGREEGARQIAGLTPLPENLEGGYFVRPTVFADVHNQMRIAREEIFGPVLCLIPYSSIDDAIAIANDTPFGLSARVWHDDATEASRIAGQLRAGQVYLNQALMRNDVPFGGFKQSGLGRELGPEGIDEFLELQSVIME